MPNYIRYKVITPPPPFNTNTALVLSRQAKAIGEFDFDAAFISKEASDLNIHYGGGGSAFHLFCITQSRSNLR
ncbi:hypothetical protein HpCK65_12420 [Helicobacter pylori]